MIVSRPLVGANTLVSHGSTFGSVVGGTGVELISGVGDAIGVSVNMGVKVKVAVGGKGVAVGIAACVCATMVEAAEIAVDCTSSALMVGTADWPPHPLISVIRRIAIAIVLNNFMRGMLLYLAVWIAAALRDDAIIADDDIPVTPLGSKAAEHLEALSPIYERAGAVCACGSLREVGKIAAFTKRCNHI